MYCVGGTFVFDGNLTSAKSTVTTKYVFQFHCRQLSRPTSQETAVSRVKRSRLLVVIGRFRSISFVSVFQRSLAVAIIMIDGSKKSILSNR